MAQALLFVIDPLESLKAYKDSSVAMMREANVRGIAVWVCTPAQLRWRGSGPQAGVWVMAQRLKLLPAAADTHAAWYELAESRLCEPSEFDAVLMRKDPPFDQEYFYATHLLQAAQRAGARIVNDPRALRDHNEKFAITEFPQFIVPTLVTRELSDIHAFLREHGDVILKPLDGMGGTGIFRLRPDDANLNVILETLTDLGERTVMAQRYIPQIRDGDKRVLLVNGVPVPYALARIPKAGESRGNLAAGGTARAQPLSERDREIALALGPTLAARGLLLVGLDIIGEHLTEINVTSPTCFVEIAQQTGFNVAAMLMDALLPSD